jgi:hypothetical protein
MCDKWRRGILAISAAALMTAAAQERPLDRNSVKINLPAEGPLALVGVDSGQSLAVSRGAAVELDLNMSLTMRNISQETIRGVALLVRAQEVTQMGRGWVALPAPNVAPGQVFSMSIGMQLLRPGRMTGGTLVEVDLDGVLFKSLAFFGPNRYNSQRSLTAHELLARRDRQYFKKILASGGPQVLQQAVLTSIARQAQLPRLNVNVNRMPAVASAVTAAGEHEAKFASML